MINLKFDLLLFVKQIVRLFKILILCMIVCAFLIVSFIHHLYIKNPIKRRNQFSKNTSFFCNLALKLLNININAINTPTTNPSLIVSNHVGILDIFVISSTIPTLFVTSVEMKETPVLGLLTEMGGCIYVERRSRSNIHNEIKEIEEALNQGFNVVIYPEGKATNGEKIHPFKKSLLMACAKTKANLLPAVLNFKEINFEKMNHKYRDWVCWYDDMPFVKSVWNATQINKCYAELEFLKIILVDENSDRTSIAMDAQKQIEEKFISINFPIQSDKVLKNEPILS